MSGSKMKPFKADNEIPLLDDVRYDMLGSLKKDGHRGFTVEGELLTASMKPQVNRNLPMYLKELVRRSKLDHMVYDYELYDHTKPFEWHTSTFRAFNKEIPDTTNVEIIDAMPYSLWTDTERCREVPFESRLELLEQEASLLPHVKYIEQCLIENAEDARAMYEYALANGYEGLMLRDPKRGYKHGRATVRENWLLKFKDFLWYDAVVESILEGNTLTSGAEVREKPTGGIERSHKKSDRKSSGIMGSMQVRLEDGTLTKIGGWKGLTKSLREEMFVNQDQYIGRWVRFRGQRAGVKDRPRIPKDVAFRDDK